MSVSVPAKIMIRPVMHMTEASARATQPINVTIRFRASLFIPIRTLFIYRTVYMFRPTIKNAMGPRTDESPFIVTVIRVRLLVVRVKCLCLRLLCINVWII